MNFPLSGLSTKFEVRGCHTKRNIYKKLKTSPLYSGVIFCNRNMTKRLEPLRKRWESRSAYLVDINI